MAYRINIMKKTEILLMVGVITTCLSACGSSDKKTKEVSNSVANEKSDNKDTTKTEKSDNKSNKEKIDSFSIDGWTEDILWGSLSSDKKTIIIDFNAEKIGELAEGQAFQDTYIGDYNVLKNNTVVDKSGKIVFSLKESEFDEIVDKKCLEAGFLICAKKVNSFEETGLHYYTVSMADGSSEEVSMSPAPWSKNWHGKYFGNGFYFQTKVDSEADTESFLYNVRTNKKYPIYKLDENGNKITEIEDAEHKFKNAYSDGQFIYYMAAADKERSGRWKVELATGLMTVNIISDDIHGKLGSHLLMDGIWDMADSEENNILYDEVNQIIYPMKDYASYTIIAHKDKDILITVKNKGGGTFFTVVNEKGERVFEPIICEDDKIEYTKNYIMVKDNEKNYNIFDWKGKQIHTLENCEECILGSCSVFYTKSDVSELSIFNIEENKEYPLNISSNSSGIGFANEHYIVRVRSEKGEKGSIHRDVLIDEKGKIIYYQ